MIRFARASSLLGISSYGSPSRSQWKRRICSISTSSTNEITDEMPYLAIRKGASIMNPVPITGIWKV